jgi:hypothetical protein
MKRILVTGLIVLLVCAQAFAVYHKIAHVPVDVSPVGGDISGDNLIMATEDALLVIDITAPAAPTVVSQTPLNFLGQTLLLDGSTAYVGGLETIAVYDITNPANPQLLSTVAVNNYCVSLSFHSSVLYASCCQGGIYIIDVAEPQNPAILGHCTAVNCATRNALQWPVLFAEEFDSCSIKLLDVQDPANCQLAGQMSSLSDWFVIDENLLYINNQADELNVFDVSTPHDPQLVTTHQSSAAPLAVADGILYTRGRGLDVYQINAGAALSYLGSYDSWNIVQDFAVSNGIAYAMTRWDGVQVLDLSDPAEPRCLGSCSLPESPVEMHLYEDALYTCYDYSLPAGMVDVADYQNPQHMTFPGQTDEITTFARWNNVLFGKDWQNIYSYNLDAPLAPQLVATFPGIQGSSTLLTTGELLVNCAYSGVTLYQISGASVITELATVDDVGSKSAFVAHDGFVYYALHESGVHVLDAANPTGSAVYPLAGFVHSLALVDDILYVSSVNGMILLDASDPLNMQLITTILPHPDSEFKAPAVVDGTELIVADSRWNEILVYDISSPQTPLLQHSYRGSRNAQEMVLVDDTLYTGNFRSGFAVISLDGMLDAGGAVSNPPRVALYNYPNPFKPAAAGRGPATEIQFSFSSELYEQVAIEIFNTKGQKVKELKADLSSRPQRRYLSFSITWDGTDANHKPVPSGVYLYQLKSRGQVLGMNKCVLMK